tara:strand:+ start:479 stop:1303 length:825 start_codon:yes stop_codon:yes gene_type:complete
MINKLEIFCVTNKHYKFFEKTNYKLAAVGKDKFPDQYIRCDKGENIFYKEENYSELTFHYWFWKNQLNFYKDKNIWIGFCQKRRFWLQKKENLHIKLAENICLKFLKNIPDEWLNYNSVICQPIHLTRPKIIKLLKKGWKNLFKDPSIIYDKKKQNIKLHFDMFHGYGKLDKAIDVMNDKDKNEFRDFVNKSTSFNPHIMFIAKPEILNKWFTDVFTWLSNCEKIFGFEDLKGYETKRLYAYLSERYLSFWFKKYSNFVEWPYIFVDEKEISNL